MALGLTVDAGINRSVDGCRSLKYEHLYREEIADVLALQDAIEAYRDLYNWIRPHEAIDQIPPMVRYLAEPLEPAPESHLSEPESVQVS